jgi:hypothetical protein
MFRQELINKYMEKNQGLFLVYFLLALIYGTMFVFFLTRILSIVKMSERWNHTKLFYIILLV